MFSLARAESFTSSSVAGYWGESWTDASGNYISPALNTTVNGGMLSAPIPTNANQAYSENDVVNYVRTNTSLAGSYYNGTLLGNLLGQTALAATFSLSNSTLTPGAAFTAGDFVGDTISVPGAVPTPGLRFVFTGAGADGEWWSNPVSASAVGMENGVPVSLSVNFDPSLWSDVNGQMGNTNSQDTTNFFTALSNVSRLGISFGSGYFFSNGFAFNTGGTATFNLDAINTTSSSPGSGPGSESGSSPVAPEPGIIPGAIALLSLGALGLLLRQRRLQAA